MSREQYLQDRKIQAERNAKDKKLDNAVKQFTPHIVRSNYVKGFTWMGIPVIQYPSDLMVIQELIWELRPDWVIETGMAFGGSALFYASVCHMAQHGRVVSIDIDPRDENITQLYKHPVARDLIDIIKGSSLDLNVQNILNVKGIRHNRTLVILDSNHTHEHVYKELQLYSQFVNIGSYIIVMDTAIEFYGHLDKNQDRPWGKGNNPWTAVQQFLSERDDFVIDKEIEQRALITGAIDGWLRRVK